MSVAFYNNHTDLQLVSAETEHRAFRMPDLKTAIARFGADAKAKLSNPSATGEPEDQLRAPLEELFADLAELCGFKRAQIAAVGESTKLREIGKKLFQRRAKLV